MKKAIAQHKNVDTTTAQEIMNANPVTIQITESLSTALKLMTEHNIRSLPILEKDQVVGIVDIRDLYHALHQTLEDELSFHNSLIGYVYDEGYGGGYRK